MQTTESSEPNEAARFEAALAELDAFVDRRTGTNTDSSEFPYGTLIKLAEANELPAGSAERLLRVLNMRVDDGPSNQYAGQDLNRCSLVAGALGACVAEADVAAPHLLRWLEASGPPAMPSALGPVADNYDRAVEHRDMCQRLASAALLSLERLRVPESDAYNRGLEAVARYSDPDLEKEVEYARERLQGERRSQARRVVAQGLIEVLDRLAERGPSLGAARSRVVLAAERWIRWVAERAEPEGIDMPPPGPRSTAEDAALLADVTANLALLAPDAFEGDIDRAAMDALSAALARAMGGDGAAATDAEKLSLALA